MNAFMLSNLLVGAVKEADISTPFVIAMGVGTVFIGLLCIILLCTLMSAICRKFAKPVPEIQPAAAAAPVAITNKQELIAAISAAVAEELGTDVGAIRVHALRQL